MIRPVVVVLDDPRSRLLLHQGIHVLIKEVKVIQIAGHRSAVSQLGRQAGVGDLKLLHLLLLEELAQLIVGHIIGLAQVAEQVDAQHNDQPQQQQAHRVDLPFFVQILVPPYQPARRMPRQLFSLCTEIISSTFEQMSSPDT